MSSTTGLRADKTPSHWNQDSIRQHLQGLDATGNIDFSSSMGDICCVWHFNLHPLARATRGDRNAANSQSGTPPGCVKGCLRCADFSRKEHGCDSNIVKDPASHCFTLHHTASYCESPWTQGSFFEEELGRALNALYTVEFLLQSLSGAGDGGAMLSLPSQVQTGVCCSMLKCVAV